MKFNILCALLVAATTATAATAGDGFVDERSKVTSPTSQLAAPVSAIAAPIVVASASPASGSKGSLTGLQRTKAWMGKAPNAGMALSLGDAMFKLLPPGYPRIILDAPKDLLAMTVAWSGGLSRAEALEDIARTNSLAISFSGEKAGSVVTIQRAAPAGSASTVIVDSAVVAVAAPAATTTTVVVNQPTASVPVAVTVATTKAVAAANAATATAKQALFVIQATPDPVSVAKKAEVSGPGLYEVRLSDIKLSTSIARWGAENGVRIRWDADKHVLIGGPQVFKASSVLDAVSQALSTPGILNSAYPLEACEYGNNPPLIRITRQGDQAKDCPVQ